MRQLGHYRYHQVIIINKEKYSQGERIARMIHLLLEEGSKSYPELQKKFPTSSKATLCRDIKLLTKTKLIIEKKEARTVANVISRKVFMFYKDSLDSIRKTRNAMEKLKTEYSQVTLDLIASYAGLPPDKIQEDAYTLARQLSLLIGKEATARPPSPLFVGLEKNPYRERKPKRKAQN